MIVSLNTSQDVVNVKKLEKLESALQQSSLVFNHANWCGHCQAMKEDWSKFKRSAKGKVNVVEIESDALQKLQQSQKLYKKVTPNEGLAGYPTLVLIVINNNRKKKIVYNGDRSYQDIKTFVDKHTAVKSSSKKSSKSSSKSKFDLLEIKEEVDKIVDRYLNF